MCFNDYKTNFQECFKEMSRVLQGSFMSVLCKLQEGFEHLRSISSSFSNIQKCLEACTYYVVGVGIKLDDRDYALKQGKGGGVAALK